VVEASLGIPINCVGKLQWQIAGMFGEAAMAEPWDGVGKSCDGWNPYRTRGGFWMGAMLMLVVKPQWVHYKLDETIEKSYSYLLAIHQRQCIFGKMENF
jgi:hypothetical protein